MIVYDFKNSKTGKTEEHFLKSSSAVDQFLADNPHLSRAVSAVSFSDRVNIRHKIDGGFKEVLQKAKNAHPLGNIDV